MDHVISPGDKLIIHWPNGGGYDEYLVKELPVMEGPAKIIYVGSYEYTSSGGVQKK